jgi:hypothetical protein
LNVLGKRREGGSICIEKKVRENERTSEREKEEEGDGREENGDVRPSGNAEPSVQMRLNHRPVNKHPQRVDVPRGGGGTAVKRRAAVGSRPVVRVR